MGEPTIRAVFDEATNTVSYLVADPVTGAAAIIDPVLDFDPACGEVSTRSAQALIDSAEAEGWSIRWVFETHVHADHLSAADYIRSKTDALVAIGAGILDVQKIFRPLFAAHDCPVDGSDFDRLLVDKEQLDLGTIDIEVITTPGHTPACVSYRIGDAVFVGDTLFMPDYGTARCDFPGGDARTLYASIRKLLSLPDDTRLFMCHDYKAPGRDQFAWETTVAEQKRANPHIKDGVDEDAFVALREGRDAKLAVPKLLLPAIQVNIRAGRLPPASANGKRYLLIPLEGEAVA
jgi:glyoxylase-like metal-dependent hydrolase (beta-lactamase superfamily II)